MVNILLEKVLNGISITKDEAIALSKADLDKISQGANKIREFYCGNKCYICTVINAKCGKCSEDCKFCAQSSRYNTAVEEYELLDTDKILEYIKITQENGIYRSSIVTAGRNISEKDTKRICEAAAQIREKTDVNVCLSGGLLSEKQCLEIKRAGISCIHNNLEASRNMFNDICTTHTIDDKINTIKNAQKVGLEICSGGIMGLGESMEDRIDLAFELKNLGVKSIPVNVLCPIKGTPYENNIILSSQEIQQIIAVFRFINPDSKIRLAGGRINLEDNGKKCLLSGANGIITGDMLTTSGSTVKNDIEMLNSIGYKII